MVLRDSVPATPSQKPPQLAVRTQRVAKLCGLLAAVLLTSGLPLAFYFHGAQCPASTFDFGVLPPARSVPFAIVLATFSVIMLLSSAAIISKMPTYSGYFISPWRAKYYIKLTFLSICGILVAEAMLINIIDYTYFCATPTNIVIRSGYFDTPRAFTWEDVKVVHAWCWTARPRNAKSYQGGTLGLSLSDGEEIPLGLVDGGRILLKDYEMIRRSLENKNYRYYTDSSVRPDSCPPELFPLLRDWRNE
jgi:hypothetical protein